MSSSSSGTNSDLSTNKHIQTLISIHIRRLEKLREKKALQGMLTDPAVLIEIEDIEAEIERLKLGLNNSSQATECNLSFDNFLKSLEIRTAYDGYTRIQRGSQSKSVNALFVRRRFQAAKFGYVSNLVAVRSVTNNLTVNQIKLFSQESFQLGLDLLGMLPRGAGNSAIVYPAIVTEAVDDGIRTFMENFCPKHWASFEFPVVVDLSLKRVIFYPSTPIWGALYYSGFRQEARRLFYVE